MKLGKIDLDPKSAALSPMAGVADIAFRRICREFGCAYTVTEMVSAKGFSMGDRKSRKLMLLPEDEHPSAIQLFGSDPLIMARAAEGAMEFSPDAIDINMGCPAPKIAGNGGGSALLKDLPLAESIIREVCGAVLVPVTVKFRTGWDEENVVAVELAKRAENAGVAALIVHGRTRNQMYAPPVDYKTIAEVKRAVSIPVIGNGDITDGKSAKKMLDKTNCDFLFVGRGALGRPWVFEQIKAFLENGTVLPEPPVEERMKVMLSHIKLICELKGERVGIREARKHAAWYIKGIRGAAEFRREAGFISSVDELEKLAEKVSALVNS